MSEDNFVTIIVSLIALTGTVLGIIVGYIGKSRQQAIVDAKREQKQTDLFERLFQEIDGIKRRLDLHNQYAEKFSEIEQSTIAIQKDIEYFRKERYEKEK